MLDDRPYMRSGDEPAGAAFRATLWLLGLNTAAFVLQNVDAVYLGTGLVRWLGLSEEGLRRGYLWQLLTFQFLHFGLLHFLLNSLMLYFFGRAIESQLGRGRFLEIYLGGGLLGGLTQGVLGLISPPHFGGLTLGASAGVSALLAVFCLLHRDHSILLFFVLPVRAIHVLWGSLAIAAFFVLVPAERGVAHAAHLGGLLAGMAYVHWLLARERRLFDWRPYADHLRAARTPRVIPVRRGVFRRAAHRATPPATEELPPDQFISQEVDPILDKISQHGIQSLTERERKILDAARAKMSRR
jgi:membrane associated rhomboid family serine protease